MHILIVGGTGGVGRELVKICLSRNHTVTVGTRDSSKIETLLKFLKVGPECARIKFEVGDYTERSFWLRLREDKSRFFDGIVLSSGGVEFHSVFEATSESVQDNIRMHLNPSLFGIQHGRWELEERNETGMEPRRVSVVSVGSSDCEEGEMDGAEYVIAKHALLGLFRSSCCDMFGLENSLRIALCIPNNIETGFWDGLKKDSGMTRAPGIRIGSTPRCSCRLAHSSTPAVSPFVLSSRISRNGWGRDTTVIGGDDGVLVFGEQAEDDDEELMIEMEALSAERVARHLFELLVHDWG
ncbi:hypothetical protein BLNAU_2268 [Blattamonas nauphoetae]|uniref:Uncharacterized protein n=1 Tax=Blattamonas nauphoetae TaxID=2049346 RepID=A0ABQ9YGF2_9EUKA|nr:hypothetical protein BLNAU_2268 [Blattamonas nauphoetae]